MPDLSDMIQKEMTISVGNFAQILGYFEHQADLQSKIIDELAKINADSISPELQEMIDINKEFMKRSSIDFSELSTSPVWKAIDKKEYLRDLQLVYFRELQKQGLL